MKKKTETLLIEVSIPASDHEVQVELAAAVDEADVAAEVVVINCI